MQIELFREPVSLSTGIDDKDPKYRPEVFRGENCTATITYTRRCITLHYIHSQNYICISFAG